MADIWHAYECFGACAQIGSGLVLDIRVPDTVEMPSPLCCPVCGTEMAKQTSWEADEDGYGSRADGTAR